MPTSNNCHRFTASLLESVKHVDHNLAINYKCCYFLLGIGNIKRDIFHIDMRATNIINCKKEDKTFTINLKLKCYLGKKDCSIFYSW